MRRGGRVTVLPVLNQGRAGAGGGGREKGEKPEETLGWRGEGTRRQLNTTADEAARPSRSRDGLRSPQCRLAVWIWRWRGVGVSGVGGCGQGTVYAAPLAPNTEAPEGWATRVCGEADEAAGSGLVCWCPCRRRARAERPVFFHWPPWHGMGQGAGSLPEYKLEREREKTLRQH